MQASTLAARSLDGGVVRIHAGTDVSQQFTAVMHVRFGTHVQQFVAGVHTFAEDAARTLGVTSFDQEYQLQGGRLRIGSVEQFDKAIKLRSVLTVAAWQGERYSMYTFAYNVPSSSRLLDVLDAVGLTETPEGVTALPKQPARTPVLDVFVTAALPGLCLLDAAPAGRRILGTLPAWRGRAVAGGELFADGSDPADLGFLLVSDTAVTRIMPERERDVDSIVPDLGALRVDWERS